MGPGCHPCISCHRCSGLGWYEFGGGVLNQLVKLCSRSLPLRSLSLLGLRETLQLVKKHSEKFAVNFSVLLAVHCPVVRVMLWQWGHGQRVHAAAPGGRMPTNPRPSWLPLPAQIG